MIGGGKKGVQASKQGTDLWLSDKLEGDAGQAQLLLVDVLVIPVTEQHAEITAIVGEGLRLPWRQGHNQRAKQAGCSLHGQMPMVEIRPRLQGSSKQAIRQDP